MRWVYIDGKAISADEIPPEPSADYHVMPDIQPYQSMVDGSMIESRSQHRAHLRQHQVIEVGNDTSHLKARPMQKQGSAKEALIREVNRWEEAKRTGRKYGNH